MKITKLPNYQITKLPIIILFVIGLYACSESLIEQEQIKPAEDLNSLAKKVASNPSYIESLQLSRSISPSANPIELKKTTDQLNALKTKLYADIPSLYSLSKEQSVSLFRIADQIKPIGKMDDIYLCVGGCILLYNWRIITGPELMECARDCRGGGSSGGGGSGGNW